MTKAVMRQNNGRGESYDNDGRYDDTVIATTKTGMVTVVAWQRRETTMTGTVISHSGDDSSRQYNDDGFYNCDNNNDSGCSGGRG